MTDNHIKLGNTNLVYNVQMYHIKLGFIKLVSVTDPDTKLGQDSKQGNMVHVVRRKFRYPILISNVLTPYLCLSFYAARRKCSEICQQN